ncbi:MAG TPA: 50S ribosomal protein L24 [Candidatus Paceibacterota bacterium]
MNIKKGDNVIVISGTEKGKTGKVLKAFPAHNTVLIEGVNVRKKHQKPRRTDQKGQIVDKTFPIHVSNAAVIDPSSGKQTRIGKKRIGDSFVRVSKKSGATLA